MDPYYQEDASVFPNFYPARGRAFGLDRWNPWQPDADDAATKCSSQTLSSSSTSSRFGDMSENFETKRAGALYDLMNVENLNASNSNTADGIRDVQTHRSGGKSTTIITDINKNCGSHSNVNFQVIMDSDSNASNTHSHNNEMIFTRKNDKTTDTTLSSASMQSQCRRSTSISEQQGSETGKKLNSGLVNDKSQKNVKDKVRSGLAETKRLQEKAHKKEQRSPTNGLCAKPIVECPQQQVSHGAYQCQQKASSSSSTRDEQEALENRAAQLGNSSRNSFSNYRPTTPGNSSHNSATNFKARNSGIQAKRSRKLNSMADEISPIPLEQEGKKRVDRPTEVGKRSKTEAAGQVDERATDFRQNVDMEKYLGILDARGMRTPRSDMKNDSLGSEFGQDCDFQDYLATAEKMLLTHDSHNLEDLTPDMPNEVSGQEEPDDTYNRVEEGNHEDNDADNTAEGHEDGNDADTETTGEESGEDDDDEDTESETDAMMAFETSSVDNKDQAKKEKKRLSISHLDKDGLIIGVMNIFADVHKREYIISMNDQIAEAFLIDPGRFRAVANRTKCEIELSRRILCRRMGMYRWIKYLILQIRGPSFTAVDQCDRLMIKQFPPYKLRKEYNAQAPVTLYVKEHVPDNTDLYFTYQRTGPSLRKVGDLLLKPPYVVSESRPLESMPWKLCSKKILNGRLEPRNLFAESSLKHIYPEWGQEPIDVVGHSYRWEKAADLAIEIERRCEMERKMRTKTRRHNAEPLFVEVP